MPCHPLDILVVDDHEQSSIAVAISLRRVGHHCARATTMVDALERISTSHPDVVIFERSLARGDGIGLAHQFRAASTVERLRIIVVSTQPEPRGFRAAERVDDYLVKPVAFVELLRAIFG